MILKNSSFRIVENSMVREPFNVISLFIRIKIIKYMRKIYKEDI